MFPAIANDLGTPEGNGVYSLVGHEATTLPVSEGTMVMVEIDDAGTVIDVDPVETERAACDMQSPLKSDVAWCRDED